MHPFNWTFDIYVSTEKVLKSNIFFDEEKMSTKIFLTAHKKRNKADKISKDFFRRKNFLGILPARPFYIIIILARAR